MPMPARGDVCSGSTSTEFAVRTSNFRSRRISHPVPRSLTPVLGRHLGVADTARALAIPDK
jgi:hypothetical protein